MDPGQEVQLFGWLAVIEIVVISIYFIMPLAPAGVPFNKAWDWSAVNYAPIAVGAVLLLISGWWMLSARHWFNGPRRTIDETVSDVVGDPQGFTPGTEPSQA